eukprot:1144270-Pelagomonas_calceolata.AAC.4
MVQVVAITICCLATAALFWCRGRHRAQSHQPYLAGFTLGCDSDEDCGGQDGDCCVRCGHQRDPACPHHHRVASCLVHLVALLPPDAILQQLGEHQHQQHVAGHRLHLQSAHGALMGPPQGRPRLSLLDDMGGCTGPGSLWTLRPTCHYERSSNLSTQASSEMALGEDVEIMSRAMRKFDRDGVVDPQAVELGDTILRVSGLIRGCMSELDAWQGLRAMKKLGFVNDIMIFSACIDLASCLFVALVLRRVSLCKERSLAGNNKLAALTESRSNGAGSQLQSCRLSICLGCGSSF